MNSISQQPSNATTIVVVLGMHRSGTSAVARGLLTMGVALGDRLMPAIDGVNDKGFWEDLDIVHFNDELLAACGRKWHSLTPIQPLEFDQLCEQGFLDRAIDMLRSKADQCELFGFKDPRTVKLLPFWSRVFKSGNFNVKYVLASRNPISVCRSLEKRDNLDREKCYYLWTEHLITMLDWSIDVPAINVDYDLLMQDPHTQLERIATWLGKVLNPNEFKEYQTEFLEDNLRHSKFDPFGVDADTSAPMLIREVNAAVISLASGQVSLINLLESGQLAKWKEEFDRLRPAFQMYDRQSIKLELMDGYKNDVATLRELLDSHKKDIAVLKEWATSAESHANAKDEEAQQLKLTLADIIAARSRENQSAESEIAAYRERLVISETYAKAKEEEVEQLKLVVKKMWR